MENEQQLEMGKRGPQPVPIQERFWQHVQRTDGCWLWLGARTKAGYGTVHLGASGTTAHRVAYELLVGPIPEGMELDHVAERCSNRHCVNPDHLEPVTHRENLLRGDTHAARNSAKTSCLRGHAFTSENTRDNGGRRKCRECHNARRRKA